MPVGAVQNREMTTIEGLQAEDGTLHAIQRIWAEENVAQCGYCQSGQIMSALALVIQRNGEVTANRYRRRNVCESLSMRDISKDPTGDSANSRVDARLNCNASSQEDASDE